MLILATAMARSDVELRFVVLAEPGPLADEARAHGLPVHELGLSTSGCRRPGPRCLFGLLRAAGRYRRFTRDVDVVDAWLVPALTVAGLLRPISGARALVAGRRSQASVARPRSRVRRWAAAVAIRQADAIVVNSQAAAMDLVGEDRVDPRRVHVIRNAVLPVAPDPAARDRARTAWGVGPEHLVVGCVANHHPGKGLPELVEAAAVLSHPGRMLRFVIVGDGPQRAELERSINTRGLDGVVILDLDAGDARPRYAGFDIAVQASESEGLPNAILEAAAAGLPIVATAVGGTPEVIEDGRTGLLVEPRDPLALAAAIDRLAEDPGARRRLGEAAAVRARDFSPEALAEATVRLYRSLFVPDGAPGSAVPR
jgi:glycosyltransferase involved in cell wall biosynthesis